MLNWFGDVELNTMFSLGIFKLIFWLSIPLYAFFNLALAKKFYDCLILSSLLNILFLEDYSKIFIIINLLLSTIIFSNYFNFFS